MATRPLKIGTFNLRTLQAAGHSIFGGAPVGEDQYRQRVDWIAHQLRTMKCELVGFQEVMSEDALREVVERSGTMPGATVLAQGAGSGRMVNGLATTLPVLSHEFIQDFPEGQTLTFANRPNARPRSGFTRPVLKAVVDVHGQPVTVVVAHLRSHRYNARKGVDEHKNNADETMRAALIRIAEARALRHIVLDIMEADPKMPVIVMGDFNDPLGSVTRDIIHGDQPQRHWDRARKVAYYNRQMHSVHRLRARSSEAPPGYTFVHNGTYTALDDIVVSNHFNRLNPDGLGEVQSVKVFNDHLEDYAEYVTPGFRPESDHGQVVAVMKVQVPDPAPLPHPVAPAAAPRAGVAPPPAGANANDRRPPHHPPRRGPASPALRPAC